ncbi:MAG: hypothetical protein IPO08_19695 [Xanthomonadales bacterium]|nr:hypothetical protein [Xanthomonadales bacterium]
MPFTERMQRRQTKDWAGVNWRDYLTAEEIERLAQIDRAKKDGQAEQRRIYDRCRKRMGPKNK